jgi:hypothetical protein
MLKIKVYIAGKVSGMEEEAARNFAKAELMLIAQNFIPVNPMNLKHDHGKTWGEYMKEGIGEMMKCHAVFALSNWYESEGARVEIELAKALKMPIMYQ